MLQICPKVPYVLHAHPAEPCRSILVCPWVPHMLPACPPMSHAWPQSVHQSHIVCFLSISAICAPSLSICAMDVPHAHSAVPHVLLVCLPMPCVLSQSVHWCHAVLCVSQCHACSQSVHQCHTYGPRLPTSAICVLYAHLAVPHVCSSSVHWCHVSICPSVPFVCSFSSSAMCAPSLPTDATPVLPAWPSVSHIVLLLCPAVPHMCSIARLGAQNQLALDGISHETPVERLWRRSGGSWLSRSARAVPGTGVQLLCRRC